MRHSKSFDLLIIAASVLSIGIFIGRTFGAPEPEPSHLTPPVSSIPAIPGDHSQYKEIGPLCFTPQCDQEPYKPLSPPPACFPWNHLEDEDIDDSPRNWEFRLDGHYRDIPLANEQYPT